MTRPLRDTMVYHARETEFALAFYWSGLARSMLRFCLRFLSASKPPQVLHAGRICPGDTVVTLQFWNRTCSLANSSVIPTNKMGSRCSWLRHPICRDAYLRCSGATDVARFILLDITFLHNALRQLLTGCGLIFPSKAIADILRLCSNLNAV